MQSQNATHGYRDKSSGTCVEIRQFPRTFHSHHIEGRTFSAQTNRRLLDHFQNRRLSITKRPTDLPQTINLLEMTAGSNGAEKGQRATATQSQYTIGHLERSRYASRFAINQTEERNTAEMNEEKNLSEYLNIYM